MFNENNIRIFLGLFGLCAAIVGPWWLPLIAIVLLSLRFRSWEAILIGLFVDFLWLPASSSWPLYFIAAIGIVWAFEPLRKELLLS